jgi:hypothetical protein
MRRLSKVSPLPPLKRELKYLPNPRCGGLREASKQSSMIELSQHPSWLPNITRKKPAPPDADAFVGVPDKFAKYFSPNPGEGD